MSYFKLDDTNVSTDNIKYSYNGSSISNRDIKEHTNDTKENSNKKSKIPEVEGKLIPTKNTFYKINFNNREPNLTYNAINPSSHVANTLYLYGKLHHNISGITSGDHSNIIGEIVIEHNNANKQAMKIFTCFLIEERAGKDTDNSLDKLIKLVKNESNALEMTVSLNPIIPKQTRCFHYEDDENHIFVYTNPILVSNDTSNFFKNNLATKTKLFNVYPGDYELIKLDKNTKEKFGNIKEGMTDEIYIDCQPTGESAEEINSYEFPLNSEFVKNQGQVDFFRMIMNWIILIGIIVASFFTIPPLYKKIVIDNINKFDEYGSSDGDKTNRHKNILTSDLWIVIFSLVVFFTSFADGINPENHGSLMIFSIFFISFITLGFSMIYYNKRKNVSYMITKLPSGETVDSSYNEEQQKQSIFGSFFKQVFDIGYNFKFLFGLIGSLLTKENAIIFIILLFFVLFLTNMILNLLSKQGNNETDKKKIENAWSTRIHTYGTFIITPLIYLIMKS